MWYYHAIYRVFKFFASFTGYEDDIFKVFFSLQVQESKFGRYIYKFGGKSTKKKLNSAKFIEFVFPKSDLTLSHHLSLYHPILLRLVKKNIFFVNSDEILGYRFWGEKKNLWIRTNLKLRHNEDDIFLKFF